MDVLENGPSSKYAPYFDIDWHPLKPELHEKVLLPILGDQYGRVLERGELKVHYEDGSFYLCYYEHRFPIAPGTYRYILDIALRNLTPFKAEDFYAELQSILTALEYLPRRTESDPERIAERTREKEIIKRRLERRCQEAPQVREAIDAALQEINGTAGDTRSFDTLDALLNDQSYRLAFWRVAAEEINYRRFFDINDLAAIRMELPEVFEDTHGLLFELVGSGAVNGLRIDHPDGLYLPNEYFEKVQKRCAKIVGSSQRPARPSTWCWKRFSPGPKRCEKAGQFMERPATTLPIKWRSSLSTVRPKQKSRKRFTASSAIRSTSAISFTRRSASSCDCRSRTMSMFSATCSIVSRSRIAGSAISHSTQLGARCAKRLPVSRFIALISRPALPINDEDRAVIDRAVRSAKRRNPGIEESVFNYLRDVLLFHFPENVEEEARAAHEHFVLKFQQSTGPIMAKGLEDTAFYIYNRLAALNEVGGEPQQFGLTREAFHERNIVRQRDWPATLLATSTHDTKRSEDVRARMLAISEIPQTWRRALPRWRVGESPLEKTSRRSARAGCERGIFALPDLARRLADRTFRRRGEDCAAGIYRAHSELHGEGAEGSKTEYELDSA